MTIDIKLIELSAENPTEIRDSKIVLEENYLRFYLDYDSETLVNSDDPMLGWKDPAKHYYDIYVKKDRISTIELIWNQREMMWQLNIVIDSAEDLKVLFSSDNKKAADKMFQELLNWWLN